MAGGRNKHGGGGGQPPFKKRKRSKAFWQQRETLDTKSRMPQANSESSSESDAGSVDENEVPESQYQSLLTAFSNGRQGETKIVDDEDKSSGSAIGSVYTGRNSDTTRATPPIDCLACHGSEFLPV